MRRREFIETCAGVAVAAYFPQFARASGTERVVVAGGGIIGASIAYHLARRGAQVTLLEKFRPACGASEKSFAWLNATYSKQPRAYYELNLLGMAGWRRLEHEIGNLRIQWGGSVEWYPEGADAEELRREVPRQESWGYAMHMVDAAEFRRLLPGVTPGPMAAAAFCEQEGTLDPVETVQALLKAAADAGAEIRYPAEVTGIETVAGRVRRVKTSRGSIETDALVVACGVDTPRVAAMAEVSVPLKDSPGVLAHTAPAPRLLERVALGPGAHIKQNPDGRIVTGASFGGSEGTDAREARGRQLLQEAAKFLPQAATAKLESVSLGWRVMPKDEYPILGFAERCPNLYIAAMHSGVTLAPVVGQFAAAEILDGARVDLLDPYRLSRFGRA